VTLENSPSKVPAGETADQGNLRDSAVKPGRALLCGQGIHQCSMHDRIELALTLIKKRPSRLGIFLFVRERTLT
jgi:hypothetical protein